MLKRAAATVLAVLLAGLPAAAQSPGDTLREALYAGEFAEGRAALAPLADAGDPEAAFGVGVIDLALAIERFSQSMHRHGLTSPDPGALGDLLFGIDDPTHRPASVDAEPLTYEGLRAILETLVDDLDGARAALAIAAESGDYVIELDVLEITLDTDGDPDTPGETIGRLMAANFGVDPDSLVVPGKTKPDAVTVSPTLIGFDRADAIWLQGYAQIAAVQADFLLAHDFSDMFHATMHRVFPDADLPMQPYSRGAGTLMLDAQSDAEIADVIAFIHTFNFPIIDRERFAGVHDRLKAITALSRANWEAILAETDDNRELVPSPDQTSIIPDLEVTEEVVAAWHETLDTVDRVLDGELLIPHWRFRQGVDLSAYFAGAERTDLVMLFTGYDALPFLAEGPIASEADFRAGLEVFGDDFPLFAIWFN
jgi:hypothetical protein